MFGMEISKPLGGHVLFFLVVFFCVCVFLCLFGFFLSKEAHPHCFGGMQNVSFKFSGFCNAFPEFQKSLFAKVSIFG